MEIEHISRESFYRKPFGAVDCNSGVRLRISLRDAGIPHYAGADSFALNGAFCGYGVDYENLGTVTADMVIEILQGADPATTAVQTFDNGIATVNTETAEAIGLDYSGFAEKCTAVVETITAEEFE